MNSQNNVANTQIPSHGDSRGDFQGGSQGNSQRERSEKKRTFAAGIALGLSLAATGALGYGLGLRASNLPNTAGVASLDADGISSVMPELLQAAATHGGENMAIATAMVGDEAEAFFALDFISGTIQGVVLNPRRQGATGKYIFNVQDVLGGPGKNPQYLMVSASVRISQTTQSSILYVVNTNTGMYAALGVPWDKTMEASGSTQGGTLNLLTTGQLREPIGLGRRPMNSPANDNKRTRPAAGNANAKPAAGAPNAVPNAGANLGDQEAEDPFGAPAGNPNAPGNPRKQR